MAMDIELKRVLAPVLVRYPGWQYARHWLFRMPIGYYVRGLVLKASWTDREAFDVERCVFPLFESPHRMHISWGRSCPIPGTANHRWKVFHPQFAEKMIEVMEQVIVPETTHIEKGADFLHYLTHRYTSHGWQGWGQALAHIHMGDLDTARKHLTPDAEMIRTRFPQLQTPDSWGHNLLELLRLIEEDPAAIPVHCETVAHKAVEVNKLQKYWQQVPFVYDKNG